LGQLFLQYDKEKFYVIGRDHVKILNPDTFEIEIIDLKHIFPEDGWQMVWDKYIISGDFLYFLVENIRGGGTANVGKLRLSTRELIWDTEINIETGCFWISEIKLFDDYLFVLTQGGTLYVYGSDL
jgi:hypothetical protein